MRHQERHTALAKHQQTGGEAMRSGAACWRSPRASFLLAVALAVVSWRTEGKLLLVSWGAVLSWGAFVLGFLHSWGCWCHWHCIAGSCGAFWCLCTCFRCWGLAMLLFVCEDVDVGLRLLCALSKEERGWMVSWSTVMVTKPYRVKLLFVFESLSGGDCCFVYCHLEIHHFIISISLFSFMSTC